jgi:hypothetical protein
MAIEYSFDERLLMSNGVSESRNVADILLAEIPGALNVHKAHETNDRSGTDWWVEQNGRHLSVDAKVREEDWLATHPKDDDLALETWSVVEKKVIGWTRNERKRSDYILWLWKDTGRWCLVPFPMLCKVMQRHWELWTKRYKTKQQFTPEGNYHSECVFVPRREVWAAIYRQYSGTPK